jgi:hypothetical protein
MHVQMKYDLPTGGSAELLNDDPSSNAFNAATAIFFAVRATSTNHPLRYQGCRVPQFSV